ncbi:hypothetical protein N7468_002457 [Penicillium chermesinum]|uniref:Uncharacterized protein n=1 Tax=Penicillium chermesinum TaxID=63820 RepID=A0A9W9PII5_9EURO|nr:uncharacterized protein N7468_002457 [Penicillium chermesinum]KAJ5247474.1 hypothetical protein N7468_002457 [Penicillium chermesinum]KAJ6145713.1 hypothetical protein N7470_009608 [Penicillium chermesinum]
MWLYRGAQSAVFYYATCTPCAESADRRKRRKDAARTQREMERRAPEIITDQPRLFPQPTAFSTNPGWREEIAMGPGPPARRGGHRNNHQRTNSWNTDESSLKGQAGPSKQPLGERLKSMRYQREDEPLWGQEVRGSSIGFSGRGRADRSEPSKYYIARAPPVNDLHPPIVSGPISRAETRWMLQPPPSAKVMAGKERFDLTSPSDSMGGSFGDRLARVDKRLSRLDEKAPARSSHDSTRDLFAADLLQEPLQYRPSITRAHSDSIGREEFEASRTSRPDSMVSMAHSDQSFSTEWKYPETPRTRPASKSTHESDKFQARPQISKTLSTLHRDNKNKVQMFHVEINDENRDQVGLGQLERIRPWRWSMDI